MRCRSALTKSQEISVCVVGTVPSTLAALTTLAILGVLHCSALTKNPEISAIEVERLFNDMDVTNTGFVDYNEFLAAALVPAEFVLVVG